MYNFNFLKKEELIEVFDDIWIVQGKNDKCTTIALTNQRLLFLDYDNLDPRENLRIGRGVDYARFKEVYYSINLDNIKNIDYKNNILKISFKDNITPIKIDNEELYKLLKEETSNKN